MLFGISLWWIVIAAAVYFGIGAVWYSPVLFAKAWMNEIKMKKADRNMAASAMITTFICILVLVIVEAYFIRATGTAGWLHGLALGIKVWLGFAATTALINSSFQNGSKKLYLIDQGYHLVGIAVAAMILAH
ncbi:MAG TPA: DUF1761 domain-containing protein [Candidatus Saccharimonadia bacterium]|jgi:hypothetical protein|nr:DUF1761 domain-containing protein [Candidatus Saccharimonadia bacterium]